jgi:nucleoside-diphosphate-sugar epimerase
MHVTDNAVMNSLLFREAFDKKVKHFVMPSCTIMYRSSDQPISEGDFDENVGVSDTYYGAGHTKVYLEKMCKFYSSFGTTKFTAIRQSNIYGPYDDFGLEKSHVFGATITKAMTFNDKITVWGTGEEERDFLFVEDLMDLIQTSIENQKSNFELVNGSYGSSVSIAQMVEKVIQACGRDLKIEYDSSKPTIKTKLAIDNQKAKKVFGWEPTTPLEQGIAKTIEWYRENETYQLSADEIDFYKQNGWLPVENLFPENDRKKYVEYMRGHANKDFAAIMNPHRADELLGQDERGPQAEDAAANTARISLNIMRNPSMVSILKTLQGKDAVGLSSQFIFKEPNSPYAHQAWRPHQDNYYPSNKNGAYVTANWFLERTTKENGTVYVYNGSHKSGLLEATHAKSFRENPDENPGSEVEIPQEYLDKKQDVVMEANTILFFHGNMIHGSYSNISNLPRPWYSCCYMTEGESYYVGKYSKRKEVKLY